MYVIMMRGDLSRNRHLIRDLPETITVNLKDGANIAIPEYSVPDVLYSMTYDFHIHDVARVEYRIATDGPAFPRGYAQIENENRVPGGNGVVAALALAHWGARVLLTGNAIGNDSHGNFLIKSLYGVENLTYQPEVVPEMKTPYAVFIRAGKFDAGALLSSEASAVLLKKRSRDAAVARFFIGATEAWGEVGQPVILRTETQDYPSLVGAISNVAAVYLRFMGADWPTEMQTAFNDTVVDIFRERFNSSMTIPTLEEVEAYLNGKR
jgi:hypothetical protein